MICFLKQQKFEKKHLMSNSHRIKIGSNSFLFLICLCFKCLDHKILIIGLFLRLIDCALVINWVFFCQWKWWECPTLIFKRFLLSSLSYSGTQIDCGVQVLRSSDWNSFLLGLFTINLKKLSLIEWILMRRLRNDLWIWISKKFMWIKFRQD